MEPVQANKDKMLSAEKTGLFYLWDILRKVHGNHKIKI